MVDEAEKYPKEFQINDRLKARIGFKDSRVEVVYNTRIPLVGWKTLSVEPAEFPLLDRVFEAQEQWVRLSRTKKGRAAVEIPVSQKVKARVGFEDRHVEILVDVVVANYAIILQEADAPKVRAAFAEARKWSELPEFERYSKGAA